MAGYSACLTSFTSSIRFSLHAYDGNSTHGGQAISTRAWFTVNGKGIVCVGDPVSCGSTVASGDGLVQVS
ncbi:hypothetical protein DU283_21650 [Escherichia coli]|nr:hypothetical protein DU283_21650 [Escherichia coli]